MAASSSTLIPIRSSEVVLGKPLPWPVYDAQGKLLLQRGFVIVSASQLQSVTAHGFFVDPRWQSNAPGPAWGMPSARPKKPTPAAPSRTDEAAAAAPASPEIVVHMEDVRWNIGETLFLQLAENPKIRYSVPLIGFIRNQTVLVGSPTAGGRLEFVREGQSFVVRAFAGKKAYAFTAAAVKSVLTPYPYLHLSYPKQIGCTVVRQDSRAPVQIIASITLGEPERTAAATMVDLSLSGCSALLKQPLGQPGARGCVKFRVCAAGNDEYLSLAASLRSVAPNPEAGGEFRHGFEFGDLTRRERLILSAFVHRTLVELD